MRKWFWNRTKKAQGVTAVCLMAPDDLMAVPGRASDWTGPREPTSQVPASYARQLFEAAHQRNADTVELALDQAKGLIRTQLRGSAACEQLPAGPAYLWSALLFTYLETAAIEACQGTIQDPVSGEAWRFTFCKEDNQIQLSKIASPAARCEP